MRILLAGVALVLLTGASIPVAPKTRNVVLVTLDGFRIQELFGGMDEGVLKFAVVEDVAATRARFLRATPKEGRETLMPFLWGSLVPAGVMLGNPAQKSAVRITNPHRISYPGYAELLTGQVQPEIKDNKPVRIPRETFLEFIRRKLNLRKTDVAAYTSWDVLGVGTEHTQGSIAVNAGFARAEDTEAMRTISNVQDHLRSPWNGVRPDAVTTSFALEHLKTHKPRVLYVALGETDDWSHDGRYDRMLEAASSADTFLKTLWTTLQSMPEYKDSTTLIVTADHGRGVKGLGWRDHGPTPELKGSDETFLLMVGPDTPARGELSTQKPVTTSQVAATILGLLGLSASEFNKDAAPAISLP